MRYNPTDIDHNSLKISLPPFSSELRLKIDEFSNPIEDSYRIFSIPKKRRRGFRQISAPSFELKTIQKEIANILSQAINFTTIQSHSFGFIKGRSIGDNVIRHSRIDLLNYRTRSSGYSSTKRKVCNKGYYFLNLQYEDSPHYKQKALNYIKSKSPKSAIRIDIKDAFPSTNEWMIRNAFYNHFNIDNQDLERLLKVCLLDQTLPQGSPSSPVLLNIVLSDFDHYSCNLINAKLGKRFEVGYRYSRYADDIIVTCDDVKYAKYAIPIVYSVMRLFGYKPNKAKTAVMSTKNGIFINGINVVNSVHHVSVTKKNRNNLRSSINNLAIVDSKDRTKRQIESLKGKIGHVMSFDLLHGLKLMQYAVKRGVFPANVQINKVQLDNDIYLWLDKSSSARAKLFA